MQTLDFELDGDYIELNQLLKLTGVVDSGASGKHRVAEGVVRVDGKTELRKTCKIRAGQIVEISTTAAGGSTGDCRIRVVAAG